MVRVIKPLLLTLLFIVVALSLLWWSARRLTERPRTAWKNSALERLGGLSLTNDLILAEIEKIKDSSATENPDLRWTNEHVLLMTNGEYIVYEYRHGRNDYFPPHLFIGHASNGQWLYSSYHFCNNMQMIAFDRPPGSVAEFSRTYSARPFDGKSDDCLQMTR